MDFQQVKYNFFLTLDVFLPNLIPCHFKRILTQQSEKILITYKLIILASYQTVNLLVLMSCVFRTLLINVLCLENWDTS